MNLGRMKYDKRTQKRMYFYVIKELNLPNANVRYSPAAYKKQLPMCILVR